MKKYLSSLVMVFSGGSNLHASQFNLPAQDTVNSVITRLGPVFYYEKFKLVKNCYEGRPEERLANPRDTPSLFVSVISYTLAKEMILRVNSKTSLSLIEVNSLTQICDDILSINYELTRFLFTAAEDVPHDDPAISYLIQSNDTMMDLKNAMHSTST